MEAGFIVLTIVLTTLGIAIGFLFGTKTAKRQYTRDTEFTQGTLNVDASDPEFEPSLLLGLAIPVREVISRKYITLDVKPILENSQK